MKKSVLLMVLLFLLSALTAAEGALPVSDGLIGYWPGDGDATDQSGNGNNGILQNGVSFSTGVVGEAFNLDGEDDYIELPLFTGYRDFTMAGWFKHQDINSTPYNFILQTGMGLIFIGNGNRICFSVFSDRNGDAGNSEYAYSAEYYNLLKDNTWHHVALTATNSNEIKAYLDGNFLGVLQFQFTGLTAEYNLARIGVAAESGGDGKWHYFKGDVDEVAFFDRALSLNEIRQLANLPPLNVPISDGLIGYWPGDGDATDQSGNGKNGILHNGVSFSTGIVGDAFYLDGEDDYIELPLFIGYRDFTMAGWFKHQDIDSTPYNFVLQTAMGLIFIGNNNRLSFAVFSNRCGDAGPTEYAYFSDYYNLLQDDKWHHIALTATDSNEIKAYLDGNLLGSLQYTFTGLSSTYNFTRIGVSTYGSGTNWAHYKGEIDEVAFFDRALSENEIQKLFKYRKNQKPVLSPIGNKIGQEGQLLEFQIFAIDPDPDDALIFSANNLPAGANLSQIDNNTALFSWTPGYDQANNYDDVEFTVTDDGNPIELDTELITITIGNVNRAPIFMPIGSQAVDEGATLEFSVEATDPDSDGVTLSANNIPAGAYFNVSTGLFSWTPGYLQEGTYTITFIAADDGNPVETSEMGVPITVGNTPNPTQLTDDLIDNIETSGLPNNVINSYLANLKKVNTFIDKGKIEPAVNQLFAFMCKIEENLAQGEIDQSVAEQYIILATEVVRDLGFDPTKRTCG